MQNTVNHNDISFTEISGFPSYYISKCGEVVAYKFTRLKGEHFISLVANEKKGPHQDNGYLAVRLHNTEGIRKQKYIHRLLLETFKPTDKENMQVDHVDGNKMNNSLDNLEWVTASENMLRAYKTGLVINDHLKNLSYVQFVTLVQLHEVVGVAGAELSVLYEIDASRINKLIKRKAYKDFWERYDNDKLK